MLRLWEEKEVQFLFILQCSVFCPDLPSSSAFTRGHVSLCQSFHSFLFGDAEFDTENFQSIKLCFIFLNFVSVFSRKQIFFSQTFDRSRMINVFFCSEIF